MNSNVTGAGDDVCGCQKKHCNFRINMKTKVVKHVERESDV